MPFEPEKLSEYETQKYFHADLTHAVVIPDQNSKPYQAHLWVPVDVGRCPHQVLAVTLTLSQPRGQL